jgi:hypothetical protein
MSTTKKAGKKNQQLEEAIKKEINEADKQNILEILKKVEGIYNSGDPDSTKKKNIKGEIKKIAEVIGKKWDGNFSPTVQKEVMTQVGRYNIDTPGYIIALSTAEEKYDSLKSNAQSASGVAAERSRELRGRKAMALEDKDAVALQITKEIDKAVGYTKADEEIIKDAVESVLSDAEDSKIGLKQIAESMMAQAMLETKKKETPEQEKKVIKLTESMAQAHVSQVAEAEKIAPRQLSMSREAEISQVAGKNEQKSSVADAFRGKSTYYNIGSQLPVPKSYKKESPKIAESMQEEMKSPILSESIQATTTQTEEPIIERAYVSEQQQMKMDTEEPSTFSSQNIFKQVKEGKTKLSDLENNFTNPIQYPDQLLKWINMIGGWEQYKYNRGKFGLIDDVKGDNEYLQNMKNCLIMVCGDDIGVNDTPVGNINQAVKELMIMKNCYYIYKFKASLPPQYGLIVNANKLMTFADILGKGAKSTEDSTKLDPKLKAQKPVVKGKERIEFEEQKKDLVQQSIENRQGATPGPQREFVPKPDINQDTIHKSQVQRGNRGLLQINMDSFNKRTINQGSLAQADAIARGIKIMKPKKQFGRY